jgi:hypothetical protein
MKSSHLSRKDFFESLGISALVLYRGNTILISCNNIDTSLIGFLPDEFSNLLRIPQIPSATGKLTVMYGQGGLGLAEKVFRR